jgi:predicted MFS family arabinose efflux permease
MIQLIFLLFIFSLIVTFPFAWVHQENLRFKDVLITGFLSILFSLILVFLIYQNHFKASLLIVFIGFASAFVAGNPLGALLATLIGFHSSLFLIILEYAGMFIIELNRFDRRGLYIIPIFFLIAMFIVLFKNFKND